MRWACSSPPTSPSHCCAMGPFPLPQWAEIRELSMKLLYFHAWLRAPDRAWRGGVRAARGRARRGGAPRDAAGARGALCRGAEGFVGGQGRGQPGLRPSRPPDPRPRRDRDLPAGDGEAEHDQGAARRTSSSAPNSTVLRRTTIASAASRALSGLDARYGRRLGADPRTLSGHDRKEARRDRGRGQPPLAARRDR